MSRLAALCLLLLYAPAVFAEPEESEERRAQKRIGRVSQTLLSENETWRTPGFRLHAGIVTEDLTGDGPHSPDGFDGTGPNLRLGMVLDARFTVLGGLRYSLLGGPPSAACAGPPPSRRRRGSSPASRSASGSGSADWTRAGRLRARSTTDTSSPIRPPSISARTADLPGTSRPSTTARAAGSSRWRSRSTSSWSGTTSPPAPCCATRRSGRGASTPR